MRLCTHRTWLQDCPGTHWTCPWLTPSCCTASIFPLITHIWRLPGSTETGINFMFLFPLSCNLGAITAAITQHWDPQQPSQGTHMAKDQLLHLPRSHMPHAESTAGDGVVFTTHLPCREVVKAAKKNENLHVGWGLPTVTWFAFLVQQLLVFPWGW